LLKPISDTGKMTVYYFNYGFRYTIGTDKYRIREGSSHLAFVTDPSEYTGLDGGGNPRDIGAIYSVYDMDAPEAVTLGEFAQDILTAPGSVLGAGFSAADIDITELDVIRIPRITSSKVRYALETILQEINECQLEYTTSSRKVILFYDSPTGKITLKSVSQGISTMVLPFASRKVDTVSLENLYNAACVTYQCDEPFTLTSQERCWHPAVGDATANTADGTVITAIMQQQLERQAAAGWISHVVAGNNNYGTSYISDNDEATGWGIKANGIMAYSNSTPVPWQYILVQWFAGASTVDRAWYTVDCRSEILGSMTYELVGLTAYSGSGLPVEADVVRLSKRLYLIIEDQVVRGNLSPPRRWTLYKGER
jgi:hypothetical protein